jgi:hypothetical protein
MSKKDLVGSLVKLRSGRMGIVLSFKIISDQMYFVVLVTNIGLVDINAKDVEIIKN